jgi:hypothetical protein
VGATAMGRGCDTAILDDPVSADQALSDAERTRANNWIDATLRSRLNDPTTGTIVLVMQRLHELDPTGFLLEQEPGVWTHVRVPLEAEEDETWVFPISGRVVQRRAGEILMPERFSREIVEQLRSRADSFSLDSISSDQHQRKEISSSAAKCATTEALIRELESQTRSYRVTSTGR